jgi:CheY-like chemotaxis protein/HPt (histidine-containing phosphotransfer) domain-containing protein
MKGRIEARSEPGIGSTFTVLLALPPAPAEAVETEGSVAAGAVEAKRSSSMVGRHVLVVDDDPVNRRVAVALLRELGAQGTEAESGHAAIAELCRHRADLVLMDCSMPGMDGFETTRRIRDSSFGTLDPFTRIVAMTARTLPADRERALASGMDDYVAKPMTLASLQTVLERVMSRTAAAVQPRSSGSDEPFDSVAFKARYEDAAELGNEILEIFLSQSRILMDEARSALARSDLEVASARLHRLKGSTGAISGMRASRAAEAFLAAASLKETGREELSALLEGFSLELGELESRARAYLEGRA